MKKQFSNLFVFSALLILLANCSKNQLEPSVEPVETITMTFQGETVKVPKDFPIELFNQTNEEFEKYYVTLLEKTSLGKSARTSFITLEQLKEIVTQNLSKYPYINYDKEFSTWELERIYNDFPQITSVSQIQDRIPIIFDFYNTLCKNDVIREVLAMEQRNNAERTNDISPDNLTDPEKIVLLSNPAFAQQYADASKAATLHVLAIYGSDIDNKKRNAFKHAVWNCLSIRYILKSTPASENQAIDFTQDGTSAHEKDNNGSQKHDIKAAMDLHNNMSARVWMEKQVKWGIGPLRKMPSENDIVSSWHASSNGAIFHSTQASILNMHGGDNSATWNNLYNNLYGAFQHPVYIEN